MKDKSDHTCQEKTLDIYCCARCGGDHKELTFRPLGRPQEEWTHWAPCPQTHEPIMMAVLPDGWAEAQAEKVRIRENLRDFKKMFTKGRTLLSVNHRFDRKIANNIMAYAGETTPVEVVRKDKNGVYVALPNGCISSLIWPDASRDMHLRPIPAGFVIYDKVGPLLTYTVP